VTGMCELNAWAEGGGCEACGVGSGTRVARLGSRCLRFRASAGAACAIVGYLGGVLAGIKAAAKSGAVGLGMG